MVIVRATAAATTAAGSTARAPVLTRTMGIIRRRGFTLSPAAQKFHDILQAKWSSMKQDDARPTQARESLPLGVRQLAKSWS